MVGLPDFKSHSKSRPFATQPLFDHSKSRLVWVSDPHCAYSVSHQMKHVSSRNMKKIFQKYGFVELYLFDIIEQIHPRNIKGQGEVLHWQVEESQRTSQRQKCLLQQGRISWQLMNPSPEPDDLDQNDWEEDGLEGQPDLGETSILVDGSQPNIDLKHN